MVCLLVAKDDPLDISSRLRKGRPSVVSLMLQDMTNFDSRSATDTANGQPIAGDRHLLNHSTWLVLDGVGKGRRYSGVSPLANVKWNESQLCVSVDGTTELSNIMILSNQASTLEVRERLSFPCLLFTPAPPSKSHHPHPVMMFNLLRR